MRTNLGADPDVIAIAAKISTDEFSVVGRLHAVWGWLDQHSDDGKEVPVTSAFLDRLASHSGFAEALRAVGWLSGRDGSLSFPGYAAHNGATAKARASAAKRQERGRKKPNKRHGGTVTNVTPPPLLEERREEESKDTPLPPEGDGASKPTKVLPERWRNIPKVDRRNLRVLANNNLMKRIGGWFGRKPETLWSLAEGIALHDIKPPPEEVELLEDYYTAEIDRDSDYRRRDLITLLNNWGGECDRARVWKAENQ